MTISSSETILVNFFIYGSFELFICGSFESFFAFVPEKEIPELRRHGQSGLIDEDLGDEHYRGPRGQKAVLRRASQLIYIYIYILQIY